MVPTRATISSPSFEYQLEPLLQSVIPLPSSDHSEQLYTTQGLQSVQSQDRVSRWTHTSNNTHTNWHVIISHDTIVATVIQSYNKQSGNCVRNFSSWLYWASACIMNLIVIARLRDQCTRPWNIIARSRNQCVLHNVNVPHSHVTIYNSGKSSTFPRHNI